MNVVIKKSILLSLFLLCAFYSLSCFSVPFKGTKFVVAGPSPHSPQVALNIYNKGGNVVDMAVAVAFALAVTHPYYVSLGSGGFALVKMNSQVKALDFRETASYNMSADFFEKNSVSSQHGGAAVGVPGFVSGMKELHKRYGKLSWSELITPALYLSNKGFPVSGDWVEITQKAKNKFNSSGKNIFFKKGSLTYKVNENFKQPKLTQALKLVQKRKSKAFYTGDIAKDIVSSVQKEKGVLSLEDFKKYQVRWLAPLVFSFRDYKIYSMPLPSSGGLILARAFKLIEEQKLYKKKLYSFDEIHILSEIMARAFVPRYLMGDPDFSKFNQDKWLSNKHIKDISSKISSQKSLQLSLPKESKQTTHFSIIDHKGNTVAMTLTLNGYYGSKVVSSKYGIVLNNQIDDFTTLPGQGNLFGLVQGKNNSIQGGKRPLSSMSPTLVEKNKQTVLALGAAGGPTIITSVLQTLYRYLINKMDLKQALYSPRVHHQFLPRKLFIEDKRFSPELIIDLKLKGHKIEFKDYIAQVFAVARNKQGELLGVGEMRRESSAGGL